MRRIKYISNIPAPYVIEMLNDMTKFFKVQAIFEAPLTPGYNKQWYIKNNNELDVVFLKEGTIESKRVNLKILKYINRKQDILIMTCYNEATELLGLLWAKLLHIPYWIEVDGALLHDENIIKKLLKTIIIRGAKGYISSGRTTDEYLYYYGVPKNRVYRYPFSSIRDADVLKKVPSMEEKIKLRRELGIQGKKVAITVGRFSYQNGLGKGFDILVRVFARLPKDYTLYIVGGEPTVNIIKLKYDYHADNVFFVDFCRKDLLFKYYQASDLFCLQTRGDAWGLVVNEAMANGLPIITTNQCVAGLNLIINGKNGYIVPVENEEIVKDKILEVFTDDRLRKKMAMNSLIDIKGYTIEKMALAHKKIFEEYENG